MEKDCYQEIIDEVSKKLADKITSEEKDLAHRATLIDRDIADIVQAGLSHELDQFLTEMLKQS